MMHQDRDTYAPQIQKRRCQGHAGFTSCPVTPTPTTPVLLSPGLSLFSCEMGAKARQWEMWAQEPGLEAPTGAPRVHSSLLLSYPQAGSPGHTQPWPLCPQ